jgi:hypothetical protein
MSPQDTEGSLAHNHTAILLTVAEIIKSLVDLFNKLVQLRTLCNFQMVKTKLKQSLPLVK